MIKCKLSTLNFSKLVFATMSCGSFPLLKDVTDKVNGNMNKCGRFFGPHKNMPTFGRSAYLCYNQSCIELALKKSKLNKALKTNAALEKATLLDLLKKEK